MERMPGPENEGVQVTRVASTPSSLSAVASPDTLDQLEFAAALERVAQRAVSELGAARVRRRLPSPRLEWVRDQLAGVAELAAVLAREDPFRPEPVADLTETLATLRIPGGVLDGPQLVALGQALGGMRAVARELARLREPAPRTAALRVDPPPRELEQAIERAFDPDGGVRDDAAPELKRARVRVRETRARLVSLLESLLGKVDPADRSGDATVTLREGRYVIPLRRGAHRVAGIVHGASGSGATLFMEPEEAVGPGNDLVTYQADEARAVLAVLRDLTDRARAVVDSIAAGWEMCIAADDLYARARYACDVAGVVPGVDAAPAACVLRTARHPLLIAEGVPVVPFELDLSGDARAVVVSGPNTGGKTVLIKAVGLLALLAQAGVIPPVAAGSKLPVYRRVMVDVGDHQSIAANLSTFSAHLQALRVILEHADASSLVLVDEIGNGTDPAEGGALAAAVLQALVRRRVTAIVTTHLTPLKDVAARTAGVENASLEFDAASLTPTYRFLQGMPGRSYGLAVAQRLGLPADVLAEAEAAMPEAQRALEALLADLEAKTQALEAREREAAARELAVDRREQDQEVRARTLGERERTVGEREREIERAGREQARQFLLEARRRVEEALGVARAAVTEATAREARRLVEEGVQREAEALKQLDRAAGEKGWRVKGNPKERATDNVQRSSEKTVARSTLHVARSEVDLRGLTVDEATAAVTMAIDAAVVDDLPWLRIIHGKGTGALRSAVRDLLAGDRRVSSARLAPAEQGGTGVTIAELKA
jgi:DNA mismatch repair protein MutS2